MKKYRILKWYGGKFRIEAKIDDGEWMPINQFGTLIKSASPHCYVTYDSFVDAQKAISELKEFMDSNPVVWEEGQE